jgi:hypothetical protein
MTYTSEFDVFDEVYTLINNIPTKCSVRVIHFPESSRGCSSFGNDFILYSLVDVKKLPLFDCISESTLDHIERYQREVGRTPKELFEKLLKIYKDR